VLSVSITVAQPRAARDTVYEFRDLVPAGGRRGAAALPSMMNILNGGAHATRNRDSRSSW
jgi:enolase